METQAEKYVFIETFGCQMNESDSERMLDFLKSASYRSTADPCGADLILVNTCSIRDKAEQKVYSAVGRYKELKARRPELIIGISGCVAQQQGEALLKRLPYVDIVVGTHNVHRLPSIIRDVSEKGMRGAYTEFIEGIEQDEYRMPDVPGGAVKAFLSIMRGCDNFCAYCIVPYVRGPEASRPYGDVVKDVEMLVGRGVKEVTLVGQNVNSYDSGMGFPELLRRVCRIRGIERVRFVTSHPKDISDELIYMFGEEEKLARALHLPAQSGSDAVLSRMKRGYTIGQYLKKAGLLRSLYPEMAITTDIIAGFPGETDEDFLMTMRLVRDFRFDGIFSFKYSPRPETEAAGFAGQIDEGVKQRRLEELQSAQRDITAAKNRGMEGKVLPVLVEGESKDGLGLTGRSSCNRAVNFTGASFSPGMTANVLITAGYANSLRGAAV